MDFVALHNHTYYSLRDGISSPKELCAYAKQQGCNAVAITDHGTISGWVAFKKAAKDIGIKPIYGIEMYEGSPADKHSSHITLLAKNNNGLRNIIRIFNHGINNLNSQGKPRIDINEIPQEYCKDIVCLTGCANTPLLKYIFHNSREQYRSNDVDTIKVNIKDNYIELATEYLSKLQHLFSDVYIEVQYHQIPIQIVLLPILRELSQHTGLPCVWTQDSHFTVPEHVVIQELIYQSDPVMKNLQPLKQAYFKQPSEIPEILPEEIENTNVVASLCNAILDSRDPILPNISIDIKKIAYTTLERKQLDTKYQKRLDHEIEIIYKYKLDGYFALIYDICRFAKQNNVYLGPGRGSVGGSLLAFLLGITQVDPIKYDLYFERFINPGRFTEGKVSLPDIDIDVAAQDRQKIYEYLAQKYGETNVCHISNFNFIHIKDAIRKYCRVHELQQFASSSTAIVSKYNTYKECIESKDFRNADSVIQKIITDSVVLCNRLDTASTHACGLIIADNVTDNFPVRRDKSTGYLVIDFDKKDVEELGGVKIDLLSLSQLDKLRNMCASNNVVFIDEADITTQDDNFPEFLQKMKPLIEYFKQKDIHMELAPQFPLDEVEKQHLPYERKDEIVHFILKGKHTTRCSVIQNTGFGILLKRNYKPYPTTWLAEYVFYISLHDDTLYNIFVLTPDDIRNLAHKYYDKQYIHHDTIYLNIDDNTLILNNIKKYQVINGQVFCK